MKKISLTSWIFIAMVLGIATGVLFPEFAKQLTPISNVFLRLIKSIIAPLIFGTLVYGIAGTGDVKTMGRIGLKAIIYFEIATTLALVIGLGAVNLIRPGDGMNLKAPVTQTKLPQGEITVGTVLEHTFPQSIIDSMARGEVLQIVVFAFIFGVGCVYAGSKAKPVVAFCESLAEIMFKYTHIVMYMAPLGVFAALASVIGDKGLGVLRNLGALVLTLYGALILFVLVVFVPVMMLCRVPFQRFLAAVKEPFIITFSTATSEAALPTALKNMEEFGVPKHIVSFVLPLGYSFNLDGSTLYLALASVFVAQAVGTELSLGKQLAMMLTLMLTSKGVAGVRGASAIVLMGTLSMYDLPVTAVLVILGVDFLMDMARSGINVVGNCLACAVVGRWEGVDLNAPPVLTGEVAQAATYR